jgi:hypothetical protein
MRHYFVYIEYALATNKPQVDSYQVPKIKSELRFCQFGTSTRKREKRESHGGDDQRRSMNDEHGSNLSKDDKERRDKEERRKEQTEKNEDFERDKERRPKDKDRERKLHDLHGVYSASTHSPDRT